MAVGLLAVRSYHGIFGPGRDALDVQNRLGRTGHKGSDKAILAATPGEAKLAALSTGGIWRGPGYAAQVGSSFNGSERWT